MSDKGCCCLCPAYIGVIICGVFQSLYLLIMIINLIGAFQQDNYYPKRNFVVLSIATGLFLVPYIIVLLDKQNALKRLILFWSGCIGFLLNGGALLYMIVSVLFSSSLKTGEYVFLVGVAVAYVTLSGFAVNSLWNFYNGAKKKE